MKAGAYGLPGTGKIRVLTGTNPAANTEVAETVPAGKRWRFISLRVQLVCDGNAANRQPSLRFDDGTSVFCISTIHTSITANLTADLCFGPGPHALGPINNQYNIQTTAGIYLLGGYRMQIVTANIQVTDNYGAPIYCVEEWDA